MIITQTPLRISFFGGGTDFEDFYKDNGGAVLSTTIDKFIYIIVKERFDNLIVLNYSKKEIAKSVDDIQHELMREALNMTGVTHGIEIVSMADIPSEGTGLGSSSAVTVGLLNALHKYAGHDVTTEELAKQSCQIEIDILHKPIGKQDQYASAIGNFNYISFSKTGCDIENISIEPETKEQLNSNLLLYYTGITRKASDILSEQKSNINSNLAILSEIKHMALEARGLIEKRALDDFGTLLHKGWELKKMLASKIAHPQIDDIYLTARKAGALGGKILGAGGGGFLLLYCNGQKDKIRQELKGLRELPFKFYSCGSQVILDYRAAN